MNLYESISKLSEADNYKLRISLTNDSNVALAPSNIVVTKEDGTAGCNRYLEDLIAGCNTAEELAKKLNDNRFPQYGDKRIFGTWTPVSTERDITKRICTNAWLNKMDDIKYDRILTVESYDDLKNHHILRLYKDGVSVKEKGE